MEHPELDPDGVPPDVIGWLVGIDLVIATAIFFALVTGSWALATGLGVVAVVVVVRRLTRRARRERQERYRNAPDLQR